MVKASDTVMVLAIIMYDHLPEVVRRRQDLLRLEPRQSITGHQQKLSATSKKKATQEGEGERTHIKKQEQGEKVSVKEQWECTVVTQAQLVCHSVQALGMSHCPTPAAQRRETQGKARKQRPSAVLDKQLNWSQVPSEEEPREVLTAKGVSYSAVSFPGHCWKTVF
ncbi:hypothetical protein MHYP_G00123700 [Metynnis hypsauchen]